MAGGKPGLPCLFPCPPWKQDGEKEKDGLWWIEILWNIKTILSEKLSDMFCPPWKQDGEKEKDGLWWIELLWNIKTILSEKLSDMFCPHRWNRTVKKKERDVLRWIEILRLSSHNNYQLPRNCALEILRLSCQKNFMTCFDSKSPASQGMK